jgi:hypothetical protein
VGNEVYSAACHSLCRGLPLLWALSTARHYIFFVVVFKLRELPAVKEALVAHKEACVIVDGH